MSIKAKNNVGGALKKATIISELGKGRKHFENKKYKIYLFFLKKKN